MPEKNCEMQKRLQEGYTEQLPLVLPASNQLMHRMSDGAKVLRIL